MTHRYAFVALTAILSGCDGSAESPASNSSPDVAETADTISASPDADEPDASVDGDTATPDSTDVSVAPGWPDHVVTVSATAQSLSMGARRIVWGDGGDIRMFNPLTGYATTVRVGGPAVVSVQVALAGADEDKVVFSEKRLDVTGVPESESHLYVRDLVSGTERLLVDRPGRQHSVAADGDIVAWIDQPMPDPYAIPVAPIDRRLAEVYAMDLTVGEVRALTSDDAEQAFPAVRGRRVVFTDFSNDPDKLALVDSDAVFDVNSDNGDIVAVDLPARFEPVPAPWAVTTDPSKQARPAIDGDTVVWLDWRGISPEPKYQLFKIFTRTGVGPELELGRTGWSRASLWQRPAIRDGIAVWIAEAGPDGLSTGTPGSPVIAVSRIDGSDYQGIFPVADGHAALDLVGVGLNGGGVSWLGSGQLGIRPLDL